MVTDQKDSSVSTPSEEEAIRHTEKIAKLLGLNEQNTEVYSALSGRIEVLEKKLYDYYSQHKKLGKGVNQLGKYIERVDYLKDDVDELLTMGHCNCSKELTDSSEEPDSDVVEVKMAIPYKRRRKVRPTRKQLAVRSADRLNCLLEALRSDSK